MCIVVIRKYQTFQINLKMSKKNIKNFQILSEDIKTISMKYQKVVKKCQKMSKFDKRCW